MPHLPKQHENLLRDYYVFRINQFDISPNFYSNDD